MYLTRLILSFTLCFASSLVWGIEPFYPRYSAADARNDLAKYHPDEVDTAQFMRAVRLGRYHVYKPGEFKKDLDSAYSYFLAADRLATQFKNIRYKVHAINLLGAILNERNEASRAISLHEKAAGIANKIGDSSLEAECWYLRGEIEPILGSTVRSLNPAYRKSFELFRKAKNIRYQGYVLVRIASIRGPYVQDYPGALADLLEAERLYKSIRYPRMHYVYFLATDITRASGMFSEALRYGMLTIESAKQSGDLNELAYYYSNLGRVYDELDDPSQTIKYFKLSTNQAIEDKNTFVVLNSTRRVAKTLMRIGKVKEAKQYFAPVFSKYPPTDDNLASIHLDVLAHYYTYLGEYDIAEKHIQKLLSIANNVTAIINFELLLHQFIGNLYLKAGRFGLAREHLNEAKKRITVSTPQTVSISIEIERGLYKLDSAQGNYGKALEHFQRFKILSDSVSSLKKNLQIAGIQIQFDTKKKEQDILALTQQNKAQLTRLEQREFQRNAMIGGTVLLSFLVLSLYVQFRNKQKSNLELKQHQQVIEESNARLTRTVEEKQLLVREIHHRVKNNLQTVISLLESQAFYLKNDALTAVKDSQNRIHAMSLIHQKLYLTENVTTINMQAYIEELVSNLGSSHVDGNRICIDMQVDPIYLDVAQAIPLGLIINEAVTNIFKYAFPDGKSGEMLIRFTEIPHGQYFLNIRDNGVGLNTAADQGRPGSLGMNLMKGLSHEMGGRFTIESDQGVNIAVQFSALHHILETEV
ncbi:MAG: hypothetical protein J7619_01715 [Dyadobacter sp.]|uniref:histidine kinase dimerization/phosphoacceptor domain -containing protein n=1 Tax=Dyadobacter sp. TaxID=1914288 RepID=UPI001B0118E7|nr:histidine kinase dimerization/phosphoacceptor domain -containing protein [Dyadobacter sp.]MBO9611378.1 hypothetical protein [Dyadobacter sp.]